MHKIKITLAFVVVLLAAIYQLSTISYLKNNYQIEKLEVIIDDKDYDLLKKEQMIFSKEKWLDKKKAKYYNCKIKIGRLKYKGKIRNKGLLLQPWEYKDGFFSYKIKLQSKGIKKIKSFWLNYPKKRNNLHEWYGDKLCEYFGLISQKNLFYNLEINNKNKGLYLFEEAFNKKLLFHNKRPEGPIIYFTSSSLIKLGTDNYGLSFFNSKIKYQFNNKYNKEAKKLLESFIKKKTPAKKVFNLDKLAAHFAIADLVGYYHQLNYHNVKFYYDPSSCSLEPIANDFQFYNIKKWTLEPFGVVFNKQNNDPNYLSYLESPWMKILFNDKEFLAIYIKKLNDFSQKIELNSLFKYLEHFDGVTENIFSEFDPNYSCEVMMTINNNAKHLRFFLSKYFETNDFKTPK